MARQLELEEIDHDKVMRSPQSGKAVGTAEHGAMLLFGGLRKELTMI